jgi:hypothetical protein
MRVELRVILWVTALAVIGLAVLRGFWHVPQLSSRDVVQDMVATSKLTAPVVGAVREAASRRSASLPDVDVTSRPMFDIVAAVAAPVIVEETIETEVYLPILKGIIEQDEHFLAVFSLPPEPSYTTIAVGDRFQGYRVLSIGGDFVSVLSPSNETVIFRLRGAGELP